MISQEIITAVSGTYVYTEQGRRRCAGNELFAVGDAVTVIGSLVVGWRRMASAPLPAVDDQYYRFADAGALKMYYLDTGFSAIVQTDDIARPVDETTQETIDATLVLHCYNADAEYLVWFAEPESGDYYRCIIQKDGETIADFMSVFTDIPSSGFTDAYIDSSGNLIWVAATDNGSGITIAQYSNGALSDSKTYTSAGLIEKITTDLNSRLSTAANAATIQWDNEVTTTADPEVLAVAPGAISCVQYERSAGELIITESSSSGSGGTYLLGLWERDVIYHVSNTSYFATASLQHNEITRDIHTLAETESTSTSESITPGAELYQRYLASTKGVIAEVFEPISGTLLKSATGVQKYYVVSGTAGNSTTVNGVVTSDSSNSTTKFHCSLTNSDGATGVSDIVGAIVIFTSGQNSGQSRTITEAGYWTGNGVFTFSSAWDYAPAVGDNFTIAAQLYTIVTSETVADLTISASLGASSSDSRTVFTMSLDNGYALEHGQNQITSDSNKYYVVVIPALKYDGEVISNGSEGHYMTDGAWCTGTEQLVGIYESKLIQADESTVTAADFSLFNGTVTKRFVGKSEEV